VLVEIVMKAQRSNQGNLAISRGQMEDKEVSLRSLVMEGGCICRSFEPT